MEVDTLGARIDLDRRLVNTMALVSGEVYSLLFFFVGARKGEPAAERYFPLDNPQHEHIMKQQWCTASGGRI